MPLTSATAIATSRPSAPGVSMQSQPLIGTRGKMKYSQSDSVGFCGSPQPSDIRRLVMPCTRMQSTTKCAVSNARCSGGGGAEQTQTILRKTPTITHLPGKEKDPQLADGDGGLPPRDDDGGGGGGGGGGNWSGGFFFFGFLALLGFMMDREKEDEN